MSSAECVVMGMDHGEFGLTGLKVGSVIRLDEAATVLKDMVVGEMGEVGEVLRAEINEKLVEIYLL